MRAATTGNASPTNQPSRSGASHGSWGFLPSQPQRIALPRIGRCSHTTSRSPHGQSSVVPTSAQAQPQVCLLLASILTAFSIWEPARTLLNKQKAPAKQVCAVCVRAHACVHHLLELLMQMNNLRLEITNSICLSSPAGSIFYKKQKHPTGWI